jgi:hypothetical protein
MAKQIVITEKNAKGFYAKADDDFKEQLEDAFGKEFFLRNVLDRVRPFEEICAEMGKDPAVELPYSNPTTNRQRFVNAGVKLDIISEYLLDNVILDWEDPNQQKWSPWFNRYKKGSGFRFVGSGGGWTGSGANAYGGARLALDTKEKSDFFGQNYLDIWNDFLNPIK